MRFLTYLPLFWISLYLQGASGDRVQSVDTYGNTMYSLRFRVSKYQWHTAKETCGKHRSVVARHPIPTVVLERFENRGMRSSSVWVADSTGSVCQTLKKVCSQPIQNLITGGTSCRSESWEVENVDCSIQRNMYLICQSSTAIVNVPTTSTMKTSPTTTAVPTTTTTTATTVSTTTSTPTPHISTPSTEESSSSILTSTTERITLTPAVAGTVSTAMMEQSNSSAAAKLRPVEKFGAVLLVFAGADKYLLGLIIAVVCGTFFIFGLCIIICCACQSKPERKKKYELVHGYSQNLTDRGHRTDTTEDTSLDDYNDMSSDAHSRCLRNDDDMFNNMIYPSLMLPPPLLQDNLVESGSVYDGHNTMSSINTTNKRMYSTLQTPRHSRPAIPAVDNNIYASINRYRKPSRHADCLIDDIPPPPPPPPINAAPPLDFSDDDVIGRGQSQCSIVGCGSFEHHKPRKIKPRKSRSLTHSPMSTSSRRKRKEHSLELVSTNL